MLDRSDKVNKDKNSPQISFNKLDKGMACKGENPMYRHLNEEKSGRFEKMEMYS